MVLEFVIQPYCCKRRNKNLTLSPSSTPLSASPLSTKFLTWTLPDLNLETSTLQKGFSVKINNRNANSVDPDKTARCEPSHQDMHCLKGICIGLYRDENGYYFMQ